MTSSMYSHSNCSTEYKDADSILLSIDSKGYLEVHETVGLSLLDTARQLMSVDQFAA